MSPDGICRPFDRDRSGFVYGQGAACLILETAAGARHRGSRPLGILAAARSALKPTAPPNPPRRRGPSHARGDGDAGVLPADVDYVNTHGTASLLGDQVEFDALTDVFGNHFPASGSTPQRPSPDTASQQPGS